MARAPSDRELGIRTQRPVEVDRLGLEGPSAAHAERYEASPPDALDEMLLGLPVRFEATTFTDLGCGKGRIVCQALRHPFSAVVGVELSAALAKEAAANVERLPASYRRAAAVRIHAEDAARHRFGPGPRVVYMYNPFRPPVLRQVLKNLRSRVDADGAPTHLLYFEPMHAAVVEGCPGVEPLERGRRWATFRVAPR